MADLTDELSCSRTQTAVNKTFLEVARTVLAVQRPHCEKMASGCS